MLQHSERIFIKFQSLMRLYILTEILHVLYISNTRKRTQKSQLANY